MVEGDEVEDEAVVFWKLEDHHQVPFVSRQSPACPGSVYPSLYASSPEYKENGGKKVIQGGHSNMAALFWYLVKSVLSSVR